MELALLELEFGSELVVQLAPAHELAGTPAASDLGICINCDPADGGDVAAALEKQSWHSL